MMRDFYNETITYQYYYFPNGETDYLQVLYNLKRMMLWAI